jgi:chaperonin GroEL (HSP60 family)
MVLILGGELLKQAEHLLIMGLVPSEVIKGYELASVRALAELESMYTIYVPFNFNSAKDNQSFRRIALQCLSHRTPFQQH